MKNLCIIIPHYQDEAVLKRLLQQLKELPGLLGDPLNQQILVVDGSRSADCEQLCRQYQTTYFSTAPGRGHQLNQGAEYADTVFRAELLWFIHADALLSADALPSIARALEDLNILGGFFSFRFQGASSWSKTVLEYAINARSRWGMLYGDQGIFVRQQAFQQAGGFAEQPLFEEVRLIKQLRLLGQLARLKENIYVDTRRWDETGWLKRTLINRLLALVYSMGVSSERLARWYRRF